MILGFHPQPLETCEICEHCHEHVWYYLKFVEISGMPVVCLHCIAEKFQLLDKGVSQEALAHIPESQSFFAKFWNASYGRLETEKSVNELFRGHPYGATTS